DGNDAAVRRLAIAGEGLAIGGDEIRALGNAAGVGVLDDDAGSGAVGVELGDALIGGIGVVDVVVGQFLALQLPGRGNAGTLVGRAIEGRGLVRILAVT